MKRAARRAHAIGRRCGMGEAHFSHPPFSTCSPWSPLVRCDLGWFPAFQQGVVETINFDPKRTAHVDRIACVRPPHRYREIAARTGGERAQQIDLGEKLQIVALLRRASPHEIHILTVEPRALEHIQHVVYIELGQSIRSNRASPDWNDSGSENLHQSVACSRRGRSGYRAGHARGRRIRPRHNRRGCRR